MQTSVEEEGSHNPAVKWIAQPKLQCLLDNLMTYARVSLISLKVIIKVKGTCLAKVTDILSVILLFFFVDFRRYALNQENCQLKWLEAEDEVRHLKNQLSDANQVNSKLQAQYHQTTALLKNEVKVRTHLQEEKKTLVDYLSVCIKYGIVAVIFNYINRKKNLESQKRKIIQQKEMKTATNPRRKIVIQCREYVRPETGYVMKLIQTAWGHHLSFQKFQMKA